MIIELLKYLNVQNMQRIAEGIEEEEHFRLFKFMALVSSRVYNKQAFGLRTSPKTHWPFCILSTPHIAKTPAYAALGCFIFGAQSTGIISASKYSLKFLKILKNWIS